MKFNFKISKIIKVCRRHVLGSLVTLLLSMPNPKEILGDGKSEIMLEDLLSYGSIL